MENCNLLAKNLKSYQNHKKLSLCEFSKELDIPKSTLRNVLNEGNANLDTVIHLSNALEIGLDMLIFDKYMPDKLFILNSIESMASWLSAFPDEKRKEIASLIAKIWDIIAE